MRLVRRVTWTRGSWIRQTPPICSPWSRCRRGSRGGAPWICSARSTTPLNRALRRVPRVEAPSSSSTPSSDPSALPPMKTTRRRGAVRSEPRPARPISRCRSRHGWWSRTRSSTGRGGTLPGALQRQMTSSRRRRDRRPLLGKGRLVRLVGRYRRMGRAPDTPAAPRSPPDSVPAFSPADVSSLVA